MVASATDHAYRQLYACRAEGEAIDKANGAAIASKRLGMQG
jgi:hypothetical protein